MSDRELLELAAKAAGIEGKYFDSANPIHTGIYRAGHDYYWNPLISDSEALRLAVKLRLVIKPGKHLGDGCTVESQQPGITSWTAFEDDKAEQMRRAIVGVAAETGKAMP